MIDECLQQIEQAIAKLPASACPGLLGNLARLTAQVQMRMTEDFTAVLSSPPIPKEDRLLNVKEASAKLGYSKDHFYHHADEYPFTVRTNGRLWFSLLGIEKWIRGHTQKRIA